MLNRRVVFCLFAEKIRQNQQFSPESRSKSARTRSVGGRRDNSRLSSCLPLTREVANPEGLTEGEIRRAYAERDTQSGRVANSLPQSPAATAPSSEGAKPCGGDEGKGSALPPTTPCLPRVRGGAERMRSGGVVGSVQETVTCNRKPVPIRYPQPLSQGLSALTAPLTQGSQGAGMFPARQSAQREPRGW